MVNRGVVQKLSRRMKPSPCEDEFLKEKEGNEDETKQELSNRYGGGNASFVVGVSYSAGCQVQLYGRN
jgi:hypothetical protein